MDLVNGYIKLVVERTDSIDRPRKTCQSEVHRMLETISVGGRKLGGRRTQHSLETPS